MQTLCTVLSAEIYWLPTFLWKRILLLENHSRKNLDRGPGFASSWSKMLFGLHTILKNTTVLSLFLDKTLDWQALENINLITAMFRSFPAQLKSRSDSNKEHYLLNRARPSHLLVSSLLPRNLDLLIRRTRGWQKQKK